MAKINFTKEHFEKMKAYLIDMLLDNKVVVVGLGTPLNVAELLHTTTINTLNTVRLNLEKQIEKFEKQDEWIADSTNQTKLTELKKQKETVNLIIGYRRWLLEKEETAKIRKELQAKLAELKESQKTPEDKIKELEDELNSLD